MGLYLFYLGPTGSGWIYSMQVARDDHDRVDENEEIVLHYEDEDLNDGNDANDDGADDNFDVWGKYV